MSKAELPPARLRWFVLVDSKVYGPFDKVAITEMVARNQLLHGDQVHIEGGSAWTEAKQDSHLASLFPDSPAASIKNKARRTGRWIATVCSIAGLTILWIAWPYYAVFSLITAVREGDVSTLERRVDWNSVRQAFRGDLNAHLLKTMADKSKGKPDDSMANGVATLLGPTVINSLVDGYVTPQAIASMARNEVPTQSADGLPAIKSINYVREIDWNKVTYAFFAGGPFSFRVDVLPDKATKRPIGLELNWSGDWRLVRVIIPPESLEMPSGPEKAALGTGNEPTGNNATARTTLNALLNSGATSKTGDTPSPTKAVEPTLIEVALLSKKYREADYRASPMVRAAITLELSIVNKTDQTIRAFDGILTFTDLLDNELHSSKLTFNNPLAAGSTVKWSGGLDYNEFTDSHRRLRSEELQNIKIKFSPRKVLYAGGSTKEFN
jgi:Protein of unknown function (DUF2939)/GYF domain 2